MSELVFRAAYQNQHEEVKVNLILLSFKDDNNVVFVYSPHLDLSGYGTTLAEAKKSFEIVFGDFIEYTLNKKTLAKILTQLGWKLKGTVKKPSKVIAPSIATIIKDNKYVAEIFDNYPVKTFHQEVRLPIVA